MRQEILRTLSLVALLCATILVGSSYAATYPTQLFVSPIPFSAGQTITIDASASGPISSVTEYYSVSDGTKDICTDTKVFGQKVLSGQTLSFTVQCQIPSDVSAKTLFVTVIFLDGDEKYVGEPVPDRRLKLAARCPSGHSKAALPCRYATGRYWAEVTKVKPT